MRFGKKHGVIHGNPPTNTSVAVYHEHWQTSSQTLRESEKYAVSDNDKTRILARADNEIAEHIDACQDLAIKPLSLVRVSKPMITSDMLPFVMGEGSVFGKALMYIGIGEVIDTEKMEIDERSQALFQRCNWS